jgi:hypothetical protein
MALLDDVKQALRITSTAYNTEITDLISACQADLGLSGVLSEKNISTDALIKRAIITYCKAHFGYENPDADRLQSAYDMIKNHITLSIDYAFYAVEFTVEDALSVAIRNAEVTFDDETKTTDASGVVVFYVKAGSNYEYTVTADGYISDDDDDNLVDVSASTTVAITLAEV